MTGYKTKSLLCMPIRSSDGEIIGVAQAINKSPSGALFTEDDEKVTYFANIPTSGHLYCFSKLDIFMMLHCCGEAAVEPTNITKFHNLLDEFIRIYVIVSKTSTVPRFQFRSFVVIHNCGTEGGIHGMACEGLVLVVFTACCSSTCR